MEYKLDIKNPIANNDIYIIKQRLCALGYIKKVEDNIFDFELEEAIKKFQLDNDMLSNGVIDDITYNRLFKSSRVHEVGSGGTVSGGGGSSSSDKNDVVGKIENTTDYKPPKIADSYFSNEHDALFRKGNLEITIKYAGKNKKTLKNVTLYNKDQVIDSNGEPIYEVYQFVAKDLED